MKTSTNSSWTQILLALLFAGLMSIPYLDNNHFYLAWIAFVPLLFAIENASLKRTYAIGLLAGFVLFAFATFWMQEYLITAKEMSGFKSIALAAVGWFFSAQVIALLVLVYQCLRRSTQIHEFILFPVTVASLMAATPMLFAMRLGESQVNFPIALQGIEYLGVYGLDVIIALSNILLYRFLCNIVRRDIQKGPSKITWALSASIIGVWFIYGAISYSNWEERMQQWDTLTVGLVQPHENPAQKVFPYSNYSQSYPPEMEMTKRLSEQGAELVVWPEARAKNYLNNLNVKKAYANTINSLEVPLLLQDTKQVVQQGNIKHFNMAVMLDEQGDEEGRYTKIKRIPIGEYIPFAEKSDFIQSTAKKLFGSSSKNLIAGTEPKVFKHDAVNIVPLICYETIFPDFVASSINKTSSQSEATNGTMLIALSNDGWFNSWYQSTLHIYASSLRAVENRVPLIHAVNNGPSIVVLPNGKRIFTSDYQQAGGYLVDVPYSNQAGGSFYSRYPNLFAYLLYVLIIVFTFIGIKNKLSETDDE